MRMEGSWQSFENWYAPDLVVDIMEPIVLLVHTELVAIDWIKRGNNDSEEINISGMVEQRLDVKRSLIFQQKEEAAAIGSSNISSIYS